MGIPIISAISAGLKQRAANKAAKTEASNINAANLWRSKLEGSQYGIERVGGLQKTSRMNAFRRKLMTSILKNPKYGLDKFFPGFADQGPKSYIEPGAETFNPYTQAGPPPAVRPVTHSALGAALGAGIGSAAQNAADVLSGGTGRGATIGRWLGGTPPPERG